MGLQEASSLQRIDGSDIDQVQRTTICAVLGQNPVQKLFAACAEKLGFDKRIFLFKSMQESVAVIDVQRSVPHDLPFSFGSFNHTALSRSLAKSPAPREKFEDEYQQNTLRKQLTRFLHSLASQQTSEPRLVIRRGRVEQIC